MRREKYALVQQRGNFVFPDNFHPKLVRSTDAAPTDNEGQQYVWCVYWVREDDGNTTAFVILRPLV